MSSVTREDGFCFLVQCKYNPDDNFVNTIDKNEMFILFVPEHDFVGKILIMSAFM